VLFLLRADQEPLRTLRETDDDGCERTFWLWPRGGWVVAMRNERGDVAATSAPGLKVVLEEAGTVTVVSVGSR
jgi:hypothetical protein